MAKTIPQLVDDPCYKTCELKKIKVQAWKDETGYHYSQNCCKRSERRSGTVTLGHLLRKGCPSVQKGKYIGVSLGWQGHVELSTSRLEQLCKKIAGNPLAEENALGIFLKLKAIREDLSRLERGDHLMRDYRNLGWDEKLRNALQERYQAWLEKAREADKTVLLQNLVPLESFLPLKIPTAQKQQRAVFAAAEQAWEDYIKDPSFWLVVAGEKLHTGQKVLMDIYGNQDHALVPAAAAEALRKEALGTAPAVNLTDEQIETALVLFKDGAYSDLKEAVKAAKALSK